MSKSPITTEGKGTATMTRKYPPIHPGEVLREDFMKPLKLSSNRLAIDLGVSVPRVNDLVREKRGISGDMALRLARYWGNTPQFWMNLQSHYELELARYKNGRAIEVRVQARGAVA
jgi:addiction module HigA family antidote